MINIDPEIVILLLSVAGLILCSAYFSGSETSLMSSSRPKLHKMEKDGHKGATRVNKVISDKESLLSTILLGNNLVNIAASALTTGVFIQLFGESGIAIATVVMTFVVLIFAEILPKTIASRAPEKHAFWISIPMQIFMFTLKPFTLLIQSISRFLMFLLGIREEHSNGFDTEDVRGAIGMGLEEGVLKKREHRMLDTILEMDAITIEDVMVHRSNIEDMNGDLSMEEIFNELASRPLHSRLPIWRERSDNIIGILHVKDFYQAYYLDKSGRKNFNLDEILQKPYFIPETVTVSLQLMRFKKERRHMALVVDEYGDLMGLVTLEDILEEIVGEIHDEHDKGLEDFVKENDGSITLSGSLSLRDANREFGWNLHDDDSVTIAGLLIEKAEQIPSVGEIIQIDNLLFRVTVKKKQAILQVNVTEQDDNQEVS